MIALGSYLEGILAPDEVDDDDDVEVSVDGDDVYAEGASERVINTFGEGASEGASAGDGESNDTDTTGASVFVEGASVFVEGEGAFDECASVFVEGFGAFVEGEGEGASAFVEGAGPSKCSTCLEYLLTNIKYTDAIMTNSKKMTRDTVCKSMLRKSILLLNKNKIINNQNLILCSHEPRTNTHSLNLMEKELTCVRNTDLCKIGVILA